MWREIKKEQQYIRVYTLRDRSTKSIKVESWRTFKEEMRVLCQNESDIFQIGVRQRLKE